MLYDVLVVGSGIAGLRAALEAKKFNVRVGIVVKTNPMRSNSSMAAGGINAALATMEADSELEHIQDTLNSGEGLCNKKTVEYLCQQAPELIYELRELGVCFDEKPNSTLMQRSFGGNGKKRTCYVKDSTGASLVQNLLKACRKEGVEFLYNHFLLNLIVKNKTICGLSVLKRSNSTVIALGAKAVVLAGGGFTGIYRGFSTNPQDSNGDTMLAAMRAGVRLKNLEFVQFHPTGFEKNGALLSEAARGEGGYLINSEKKRFVHELDTRDKVTLAVYEQLQNGNTVYLDVRHLGEQTLIKKLPSLRRTCMAGAGIDPNTECIPISPSAHYSIGGIETKTDTSTAIKGLFTCGENTCNGAHGANRLGGNSLLEGIVFGKKAGMMAARYGKKRFFLPIDYEAIHKDMRQVDYILEGENLYNINAIRKSLGKLMFEKVGIVRKKSSLLDALEYLQYLRNLTGNLHCIHKTRENNVELIAILELKNALEIAEAVVLSALKRKESLGAHQRSDFEEKAPTKKHSFVRELKQGYFKVELLNTSAFTKAFSKLQQFFIN